MHYLAHFYLSGDSSGITVGNFIGETRTLNGPSVYKEDIQNGIFMHQEIDEFTNKHPVVARSRKRLNPKLAKYSAAIIDVFYDHFLAANWSEYHPETLEEFAVGRYHTLLDYQYVLPYKAKCVLQQMIVDNALVKYATLAGITKVKINELECIKSSIGTQISNGMFDLMENYGEFKKDFSEFFPQLISFVKELHLKRSRYIEVDNPFQQKLTA